MFLSEGRRKEEASFDKLLRLSRRFVNSSESLASSVRSIMFSYLKYCFVYILRTFFSSSACFCSALINISPLQNFFVRRYDIAEVRKGLQEIVHQLRIRPFPF